jgi:hypothetical protein
MEEINEIKIESLEEHYPSLCIPRVLKNIDTNRIRSVFESARLGRIERIDVVEKRNGNGEITKRIFIHFQKWFCNEVAQNARKRLVGGKDIKIVYEFPWYWKVSANKGVITKHKYNNHAHRERNHNHTHKKQEEKEDQEIAVILSPSSPEFPPKIDENMHLEIPRAPLMKKKYIKINIPSPEQNDIYTTPLCPIALKINDDEEE